MRTARLTVQLRSDLKEVPRLHDLVEQFAAAHGVDGRVAWAVNLALEEVVTNVVKYSFPPGEDDHHLAVRLMLRPGELTAEVEDDGRAFDPLAAPVPDTSLPLEQRPVGGLGIHLVRNLMDTVEYRRNGPYNLLTLRKRWQASGQRGEP